METRFGINFDRFAKRFKKNIYGSQKGELRNKILWQHMQDYLPLGQQQALKILDLGGGEAPFAEQILDYGHELYLCDISSDMLSAARERLTTHLNSQNVHYIHSPLQEAGRHVEGHFDIIIAHAVIEWLPEPEELLAVVNDLLEEGGYLSLMFYNRNSLLFRNMQLGNWKRVKHGWLRGRGKKTLTPINPQDPAALYELLAKSGLHVISKAGVRVFYDYLDRDVDRSDPYLLYEMEERYSRQEPFLSLARYIHVICRKA